MFGYVYLITNLINKKKYIGMHQSEEFDEKYYGSGVLIKEAVKEYGKEIFKVEVLHWCETAEDLLLTEVMELKVNNVVESDEYYNMIDNISPILFGKDNGFYGRKHTDETKHKISKANLGRSISDEHYTKLMDYVCSEEGIAHYERLSEMKLGVPLSEEHKQKIIDTTTTDEFKTKHSEILLEYWDNEENYNRVYTDEHRALISKRFKDIPKSEIHRKKIGDSHRGTIKPWVSEIINKDPDKIRKTAEKHRGMKRSIETCMKISESRKGKPANNKGKMWIHNPELKIRKFISKNESIPNGWYRGLGKFKNI